MLSIHGIFALAISSNALKLNSNREDFTLNMDPAPKPDFNFAELSNFDKRMDLEDENVVYNNTFMCLRAIKDKLTVLSKQNERVVLLGKSDLNRSDIASHFKLPSNGAVLFIVEDSDETAICRNPKALDDPRILAVAAVETTCVHPKVRLLPIGFQSALMIGRIGRTALNTFMDLIDRPVPTNQRKYKVTSDAHLKAYSHPSGGRRADRVEMNREVQWSAIDDRYKTKIDRTSHYKDHASQSKLALCPEGMGLDTERFYHNYAMRTRCIVRKGYITPLQKQFPGTIVVDSWSDVTVENVQKWLEEDVAPYDPKLITSDYWIQKYLVPFGIKATTD